MAERLRVGDIVQLKSGGPQMTVIRTDVVQVGWDEPGVTCTWFAGAKNERGTFLPDALVPASEEAPKK
jgi:uncharacterized protein YodC (DUF2158 family)